MFPCTRPAIVISLLLLAAILPPAAHALTPDEILVVANRRATSSVRLATYYMRQRGIPEENLIKLWADYEETCSRDEYNKRIARPIREALDQEKFKGKIRCLVLMYGVPLRIAESLPPDQIKDRKKQDTIASVDSEISLVLVPEYPLEGWRPNPYFLGFAKIKQREVTRKEVLLVSRLDGPNQKTVTRIIDDSIACEKEGPTGSVFFDARWPRPKSLKKLSGYAFHDASIHLAAQMLNERKMPVVLEESEELFAAGSNLPAFLYCGWYSAAKYIDAFAWQRGAVGFHIASGECVSLKNKETRGWCKGMLEHGAAATIGPVHEPYVQSFPLPHFFFPILADGKLSLVEAYYLSLPFLSWKMVLVGDPLYRPFMAGTLQTSGPPAPPEESAD